MSSLWVLFIAFIILSFALFVRYFADEVLDEEHHFIPVVVAFLIAYAVAAIAIGLLNPLDLLPGTGPSPTILSLPF